MKRTIYKYDLSVTDQQTLQIPEGAEILTVQLQRGNPRLWVLIQDTKAPLTDVKIYTFGTGNPIPDDIELIYIGTYQLSDGGLVFHVFY